MTKLPDFRYHPDPFATGSIVASPETCRCCGAARGLIYVGPVYAVEELDSCLCPWCIESGAAAKTFDASFTDEAAFDGTDIDPEVVDEVCLRTPSYSGWQQEQWLVHCNDACAYLGYATPRDLAEAKEATIEEWERTSEMTRAHWTSLVDRYVPGGEIGFYKFSCLHCDQVLLAWDSL